MGIVKTFLKKLLNREKCPERLALSLALSTYIAFCPLVGLHTVLSFFYAWMFSLNGFVVFAVSNAINNPFTMIPIYASGHMFGKWIFSLLGVSIVGLDPWWMEWLNENFFYVIGISDLSLAAFFIGGNILGLLLALIVYPCARYSIYSLNVKFQAAKKCYDEFKHKRQVKKYACKNKDLLNENSGSK